MRKTTAERSDPDSPEGLGANASAALSPLGPGDTRPAAITLIDDHCGDPEVRLTATLWQDHLQRLAHGLRRIALADPRHQADRTGRPGRPSPPPTIPSTRD